MLRAFAEQLPATLENTFTTMLRLSPKLPHLPLEVWSMILNFAVSLPIFFDNAWEGGVVTPFDAISHAQSPHDLFDQAVHTKKAVAMVCHDWYFLTRGSLYTHLVFRQFHELKRMVKILERSELEVLSGRGGGKDRVPLGWHVTHVKFLITVSATGVSGVRPGNGVTRTSITDHVRRLVARCPRLSVLIDGVPYGHDRSPLDDPTLFDISTFLGPSRIRSLIWPHGGPSLDTLTPKHVLQNIRHLQCTTLHGLAERNNALSTTPSLIALPNLVSLDMYISWNNYLHWQGATQLALPSLQYLTIRAPIPGDATITPEAVEALEAFLDVHGPKIRSLDLRAAPRGIWPSPILPLPSQNNVLDVCRLISLCPSLVEMTLSAGWLTEEMDVKDWHHQSIERIGLRDLPRILEREDHETLLERADRVLSTYRQSSSLLVWSVETLLQAQIPKSDAHSHLPSRIIRVFLGLRSSASVFGKGWKERSFPALKSIHVIDWDARQARLASRSPRPLVSNLTADTVSPRVSKASGRFVPDSDGEDSSQLFRWNGTDTA